MDHWSLFLVKEQKSRLSHLLHECFIKYKDIYKANADDVTEVRTHCIRKVAAAYCCVAVNPGPHCYCMATY